MDMTRIDRPKSDEELSFAFAFLDERGVHIEPKDDVRMLIHRNAFGHVNAVVAFHRWCHRTASLSVASEGSWMDRGMIVACADYAFNVCRLTALHVQISSANQRALEVARHIGWRQVHHVKGGWSDGTDLVMLELSVTDIFTPEKLH